MQASVLAISLIVSIILGLTIIPVLKKLKVGQIERDDGPESHLKKQGTPTMGGIIIILTMIIMIIGLYIFLTITNKQEIANKLIPMVIMTIGFGLVGFIDDFKKLVLKNTKGLKPSYKMLGLLVISITYVLFLINGLNMNSQTYIPILKEYIEIPMYLYIPFAVIVILGTTNAVNLTDGIDGLSSSVCVIIIACLSIIGINIAMPEITILGCIVIGALLGFLVFNMHPAKVFMGDTGSLLLGGVISCMALYIKMPLLLIVIALVPVIETISVIIQVVYFKKTGKRFFKMAPLHHHFELSGWKENKVVIIFGLITLILCAVGLMII